MPEEAEKRNGESTTVPVSDAIGENGDASTRTDTRSDNANTKRFSGTATDEEFHQACRKILADNPLSKDYPDLFEKAAVTFVAWRKRFATRNPKLWKRLFDADRVVKEFVEAAPVLHSVLQMIEKDDGNSSSKNQTYTIIDLCSGKGYLGMLLSDMLPPSKVFRIVLMDKAWPLRNAELKGHHINWEHIYGTYQEDTGDGNNETTDGNVPIDASLVCREIGTPSSSSPPLASAKPPSMSKNSSSSSYYDTWPIPIDTSRQDLKASRQREQIRKHFLSNEKEHPVIMLGIHLCGILSLSAIDLFNDNPAVRFLALKPCCLPGMVHAKRHKVFKIGTHCFPAEEVCVHGKWNKNKWVKGPPRRHLEPKFHRWAGHLYRGIGNDDGGHHDQDGGAEEKKRDETVAGNINDEDADSNTDKVRKVHTRVCVQHEGGFQNDFLFAERLPMSSENIWRELAQHAVVT